MYIISRWIYEILDICNLSAKPDIPYIYNVHNFLLNLRNFGYSISLQNQTFHTYKMYTISHWIYEILDIQFFLKTGYSVHLLSTIYRWIYAVLGFQFICKSRRSVHLLYTISCWIYAILDFHFICKSRHLVCIMYLISHWI